jgi:hypothetical protein
MRKTDPHTAAAAQYRSTGTDVRAMAQEATTPEIRDKLLTLTAQFDRLAEWAEAKAKPAASD